MLTVTCPECGRELTVSDPERKFMFCRYCGAQIQVASCIKKPSSAQSTDSDVENLRAQHELELERLRHEHELEMERIRHEHEMEREHLKYIYAEEAEPAEPAEEVAYEEPAPKSKRHKNKSLSWKAGHFCRKHPIWTIFIVYVLFMGIFGGSSSSSTSTSSSKAIVSSSVAVSSDLPDASSYTEVYADGSDDDVAYLLFDYMDRKVCFTKKGNQYAFVTDFAHADFTNGFDSVFYSSDGSYINRHFQYKEVNGITVLSVIEQASDESEGYEYYCLKVDQPTPASILGQMSMEDCSSN